MMRTLTVLMAALALASAASAATVSVDTDKATYFPGETITITTTLTTDGAEPSALVAWLALLWNDPQVFGVPGPAVYHTALTSGAALPSWTLGSGTCLAASCFVIDQTSPLAGGSVPDAAVVVSTLTLVADLFGLLNFSFGTTDVFGATPTMGANMAIAEIVATPMPTATATPTPIPTATPTPTPTPTAHPGPDSDSDGTPDVLDFCKMDPTAPVPCGFDTDMDGYGNACDADLNNDGLVNGLDFSRPGPNNDFLDCFLTPQGDVNGIGCDLNCDTLVGGLDFTIFLPAFLAGGPPGPSGLACAGTVPCP